jgi:hypothetical protein
MFGEVIVKVREHLGGEQRLLAMRTVQVPATRPVLTSPVLRHTASQALLVYRLGLFPYMWVLRATSKIGVLNIQYLILSSYDRQSYTRRAAYNEGSMMYVDTRRGSSICRIVYESMTSARAGQLHTDFEKLESSMQWGEHHVRHFRVLPWP